MKVYIRVFFHLLFLSPLLYSCPSGQQERFVALPGDEYNDTIPVIPFEDLGILPVLRTTLTDTDSVAQAFHLAMGTMSANVRAKKMGVLQHETPLLFPGLAYNSPTTRDASFNAMNGSALLFPRVTRSTLLGLIDTVDNHLEVSGHYWDKVLWIPAIEAYCRINGDSALLSYAYPIAQRTITVLEQNEFADSLGLFRGPAVNGEGTSAYPAIFDKTDIVLEEDEVTNSILQWAQNPANASLKAETGFGLPMHCLSTNAAFFKAYTSLASIDKTINKGKGSKQWQDKADALNNAMQRHFWKPEKGTYTYLLSPTGNDDRQEGMGLALLLSNGQVPAAKIPTVLNNAVIQPAGIPALFPVYERFADLSISPASYGRHSGTVWGHIKGLWAVSALQNGGNSHFLHEFNTATSFACRDQQFAQIYHPTTTLPYGGWQMGSNQQLQRSSNGHWQTWSATAYFHMVLHGLLGLSYETNGLLIQPNFPISYPHFRMLNIRYRKSVVNVYVKGQGKTIKTLKLNGRPASRAFVPAASVGTYTWEIELQ